MENYLIALHYRKEQGNFKAAFAVYNSIGNAYFYLGDYASELQWSKEALEFARVKGDTLNEAQFAVHCADACNKLSDSLSASAYYDRAMELYRMAGDTAQMAMTLNNQSSSFAPASAEKLSALKESARLYEKMTPSAETQSLLSHVYCNTGIWYAAANRHDSAAIYYDKAMNTVNVSGDKYKKIFVYSHIAEYYIKRNNPAKAKQLSLETVELIHDVAGDNHTFDIALKVLSKIYALENDYGRAYETLLKWSAVNDSVHAKSLREEKDKINSRYTFESHRQEQLEKRKRIAERNRNYFIFALGACLLLAVALGIYIYYNRKLAWKNRELIRKAQQWANVEPSSMIADTDELPEEEELPKAAEPDETDKLLFAEIEHLIDGGLYRESNLSLYMLAAKTNQNPTYISKAVSRYTGKTFKTWLNEYRIKEAVRLLSDKNNPNISIDTLAFDTGFNDRTTFYRVFKKTTGISPTDFKKNGLHK
ncbi:hypothetical protein AGMMS50239_29200 [Bacteroidia bacterium]|nr:hypothetical protein AGMMS50239_29200 [Bacteroidia bacterium]